ncbi:MAG: recombination mediator RecR [bacterium]
MQPILPQAIKSLTEQFCQLPGIGTKTAERFVFYLLKKNPEELKRFASALGQLKENIKICSICQNLAENDPCFICSSSNRDQTTICVVAEPTDLAAIEKTGDYRGAYHVLNGVLNPIEGITPDQLKIDELVQRIKKTRPQEIILALNPDIEGEATSLYLNKILKALDVKVTRIAKGLPLGSDLEYADQATLSSALANRRNID